MQLSLDHEAEVVEIQVIEVIVERVFNFLANFEETKVQEGSEAGSGNGEPTKVLDNLEGKSQKINPDRHAEMSLVCEWKRCIGDTLEIAEGILDAIDTTNQSTSDGSRNVPCPDHEIGIVHQEKRNLHWNVTVAGTGLRLPSQNSSHVDILATRTAPEGLSDELEDLQERKVVRETGMRGIARGFERAVNLDHGENLFGIEHLGFVSEGVEVGRQSVRRVGPSS